MINKTIRKNKKKYIAYNNLRREIFHESFPEASFAILYQLPWLLSINRPECPGYVRDLKANFRVFSSVYEKEIKRVEDDLKKDFSISDKGTLLRLGKKVLQLEGLYTIGSVGTISQTAQSDCDIWICYDKKIVNGEKLTQLKYKADKVAEWVSEKAKIPVYFFLTEKSDIKNCRFGSVGGESSGSAQANVLKEEFYRTMILICGKIPLWWLCYDSKLSLDYDKTMKSFDDKKYWSDEFLDIGNLEKVDPGESFGAALWQLNKSLEKPLKSIFKMLLLKMQLEASYDELVCHKFRQHIIVKSLDKIIPDPVIFSMFFLMNYFQEKSDAASVKFVNECFFLRCQMKSASSRRPLKKKMTDIYFNQFKVDRATKARLEKFESWELLTQIEFGREIFNFLLKTYSEIARKYSGIDSKLDRVDLTILGRKIQSYYEQKKNKVVFLPKPTGKLSVPWLTLMYRYKKWHLFCENDKEKIVYSSGDMVHMVFFLIHNEMLEKGNLKMLPNSSGVSLQEILNLGMWVKSEFQKQFINKINEMDFLKSAFIKYLAVILNFESEVVESKIIDIGIAVINSWGEIFVKKISAFSQAEIFLKRCGKYGPETKCSFYIRKKHKFYSKHISKAKREIMTILNSTHKI